MTNSATPPLVSRPLVISRYQVGMQNRSIRSQRDFDLIHRKGKRYSGVFFSLNVLRVVGSGQTRFGIIAGLKVSKSAVVRNKKRRQLREIIHGARGNITEDYWCVIVVYQKALEATYADLKREFEKLGKTARIIT